MTGITWSTFNAASEASNQLVVSSICSDNGHQSERESPHQHPRVRILDAYAWTYSRCDMYDDAVHHSMLGSAHVMATLVDMCDPKEGVNRSETPMEEKEEKDRVTAARARMAEVAERERLIHG